MSHEVARGAIANILKGKAAWDFVFSITKCCSMADQETLPKVRVKLRAAAVVP
jgi:hypothetical protein